MGSFFAKSGNGRGIFPDKSVDELESLFTNDDEKDERCPCAIEDNPQDPTEPTACEPAEPVYQEVRPEDFLGEIYQYRFILGERTFGDPAGEMFWTDENGIEQSYSWPECNSRVCASAVVVFCAMYGSITFDNIADGTTVHAFNEPCPPGSAICFSEDRIERLGNCPN